MQPQDVQRLIATGKHKSSMIADLPGNYLNLFARKGCPAGEIGRLLQLTQKIDHNGLPSLLEPLRKREVICPARQYPRVPSLKRTSCVWFTLSPCGASLRLFWMRRYHLSGFRRIRYFPCALARLIQLILPCSQGRIETSKPHRIN